MRLAFIVLIVTVGAADAEPEPSKLTVTFGVGVTWSHLSDVYLDAGINAGGSARLDVAYRVHRHLAIGVHGGFARAQGLQYEYFDPQQEPCPPVKDQFDFTAVEAGVTGQLVFDRFWIAPWIGVSSFGGDESNLGTWGNPTLGYGVTAGYGVVALQDGHYIDVYGSAMGSLKDVDLPDTPPDPFVAFSVGIAYRY